MTTAVVSARPRPGEPAPTQPQRRRQRPVGGVVGSAALWVYAIGALVPLLLMVSNSLRSTSSLYSEPLSGPWPPSVDSYRRAWTEGHFGEYFVSSLLVTTGAVLLSTAVATMAAYGLARSRSRILSVIESVFLSGLLLPIHLAVLPIFYLMDGMGLVDSRFGLMLVYAAAGVPFSIFVLTTFFRQLPPELEEAARIDGASTLADVRADHAAARAAGRGHGGRLPVRADLERLPLPAGPAAQPREVHRAGRPDLVLR